jgi:hypothetical protein
MRPELSEQKGGASRSLWMRFHKTLADSLRNDLRSAIVHIMNDS